MNSAICFCMFIIGAAGCEDEILLIPESMTGDVYSSSVSTYALSNLLDGSYSTYWRGNSAGEYVYYYFPSKAQVMKIFIQR